MELAYPRRPLVLGTGVFIVVFAGLLWFIGQLAGWIFAVLNALR